MKIAKIVRQQYPDMIIEGDIFPAGAIAQMIANLAGTIFMVGLVLMFFGETIARSVNIPSFTQAMNWISQNKMQTFIIIYIINIFGSNMLNTGAFEVTLNDELIHSKLQTGQMPSIDMILSGISQSVQQ
mmetsp:Transcript_90805/g.111159  ORF Transcript_90805/g.111159 Transcript_90805/m.111159 type:complete len:129 (+) Transcript_90805:161-547(+)